jgi:hypothetical protein
LDLLPLQQPYLKKRKMNKASIYFVLALSLLLNLPTHAGELEIRESLGSTPPKVVLEDFTSYSTSLYEQLADEDLDFKAFQTALKGFVKLQLEDRIENTTYLTVIDMSRSANEHRFFLINLSEKKIEHKSRVAHGRNSGGEYAKSFSNTEGSFKTSLGFYKTAETYHGKHGLSLRLDGLEQSNNNARDRAIVIHAADYVSQKFIAKYGRLGRSLGCPSLPEKDFEKIVHRIKEGTLLFIYYPEESYLSSSPIANHQFGSEING